MQSAGQRRRRRFAARRHQDLKGGVDLLSAHTLLVVVPADIRHEICALRIVTNIESLVNLNLGKFEPLHPLLLDFLRNQKGDDGPEDGHGHQERTQNDETLEVGEHDADPRVVSAIFKTAERFAELEFTGYVEGHKVKPVDDVDRCPICLGAEFVYQPVEVDLKEVFLLFQRPLGEGMGEQSTNAGMISVVGGKNGVRAVRSTLIPEWIAGKILLAAMVAVNVLPGLWINK